MLYTLRNRVRVGFIPGKVTLVNSTEYFHLCRGKEYAGDLFLTAFFFIIIIIPRHPFTHTFTNAVKQSRFTNRYKHATVLICSYIVINTVIPINYSHTHKYHHNTVVGINM